MNESGGMPALFASNATCCLFLFLYPLWGYGQDSKVNKVGILISILENVFYFSFIWWDVGAIKGFKEGAQPSLNSCSLQLKK